MSYIVRASWWEPDFKVDEFHRMRAFAFGRDVVATAKELGRTEGTVTITKDGEVIREYKVGEKE